MSGILKRPKLPSAPAPEAPPEVIEEDIEDDVKKRARRQGGRRSTILTGDLTKQTPDSIGRKTLLG